MAPDRSSASPCDGGRPGPARSVAVVIPTTTTPRRHCVRSSRATACRPTTSAARAACLPRSGSAVHVHRRRPAGRRGRDDLGGRRGDCHLRRPHRGASRHESGARALGGGEARAGRVPAGTASCAGDLPAQVGATVGCTLSGPEGVSKLDGPDTDLRRRRRQDRLLHRAGRSFMIGSGRAAAVLVAAFTALAALTACAKVATDDSVEEQITASSAPTARTAPPTCRASRGESIVCKATKGAEAFDVKVTVTSVAGDTINFTIERVGAPPAVVTPTATPDTARRRRRRSRAGRWRRASSPSSLPTASRSTRSAARTWRPRSVRCAVHPEGRRRHLRRHGHRDERAGHGRQVRHPGRQDTDHVAVAVDLAAA